MTASRLTFQHFVTIILILVLTEVCECGRAQVSEVGRFGFDFSSMLRDCCSQASGPTCAGVNAFLLMTIQHV